MPNISKEAAAEIGQLPLILGKTLGGLMAVIGLSGWVYVLKGPDSGLSPHFFIAGLLGLILFVLCEARLKKRVNGSGNAMSYKKRIVRSSISWLILIALAALFILIVLLVTR